ncbi:MAG: hypothetical protein AB7R55_00065 [Gemmatimonadales bacterium]
MSGPVVLTGWLLALGLALPAEVASGQARPPLALSDDSTGVLTAIRAIDFRQLCRCPTVVLDSVVRTARRISMFSVLDHPPWLVLSDGDVARLRLARHRVRRSAIGKVTRKGRDSVFVATQMVAANDTARRVLLVATPPSGTTEAYLVALATRKGRWRVQGVRAVLEP